MNGLQSLSNDLAAAVEHGGRSVFGVNGRARLGSTGVHWRQGLVVTADHTVHVDEEVTITRPDGRALTARVAGRDPTIDIAVLKVDAPGVEVAEVADSDAVRVGHIVLALGAGPRASWGVVSSIGEGRRAKSAAGELFHLDLTLYPGFSGGPLVDVGGRVVGITTSGASRHLQCAVRASAVSRLVDHVVQGGRIPRAYLGVGTQAVVLPDTLRERLHLAQRTAVIAVNVKPDSPAAAAGLIIGDIIVSVAGHAIAEPEDLMAVLRPDRVGRAVTLSILRGGEPRDLEVIVGERPQRA
jgi:S1-C subfamily serine protease